MKCSRSSVFTPVTGSCLLFYQIKDGSCITIKANRLLFYLLWTEGFIVIETGIDCLQVIIRHLPERILDDDRGVCSYPNFKKQDMQIFVPVNEIGKESSKSGAQNQGLVSNLQAPDFVLSL